MHGQSPALYPYQLVLVKSAEKAQLARLRRKHGGSEKERIIKPVDGSGAKESSGNYITGFKRLGLSCDLKNIQLIASNIDGDHFEDTGLRSIQRS
jgi:hypothetical protein